MQNISRFDLSSFFFATNNIRIHSFEVWRFLLIVDSTIVTILQSIRELQSNFLTGN